MKKIAIMQPYFFPYIGYFQLVDAVDEFVIYDNIQFTKKGWVQRNRVLVNGESRYISLQIKKNSSNLNVVNRFLADSFDEEKKRMLRRLQVAYSRAPYFDDTFKLLQKSINFKDNNLFLYIYNSFIMTCNYIKIKTKITVSSTLNIDHDLKAKNKVVAICKALDADIYINPIGGVELYNKREFRQEGIDLRFLRAKDITYKQFDNKFVPNLSIIDVMMFNFKEDIYKMLDEYELV